MDKTKKTGLMADLGLLVVAVVWGTGFVASKNAIAATTPMMVMAIRFTVAFLIAFIVFFKHLKGISKDTLGRVHHRVLSVYSLCGPDHRPAVYSGW